MTIVNKPVPKNSNPKISVAVCTYRRFDLLRECLARVNDQTLPSNQYEIIVIDNSLQPDRSKSFLNSLPDMENLNYEITDKCGIAYARNVAIENCHSPFLLFTDDDVRIPKTWCEDYLELFRQFPAAGVIGGRVDPIWPRKPPKWLKGQLLQPLAILNWNESEVTHIVEGKWLVTANAGYRLKALEKGGGFCEKLGRKGKLPFWHAELGANLAIQASGFDLLYAPHIIVSHMIEPQRLEKEWFYRQQIYGGASAVAVEWQKEDEIDFNDLAQELEKRYESLLGSIKTSNDESGVTRATNTFQKEGRRICLEYLHISKEETPPPRNEFWPVFYIVTPCLNAASTIDQTIMSVISQAGDFSIRYHIQDGGSNDGTLDKLKNWHKILEEGVFPISCNNIVFSFSNEPDNGMYDALVKGFKTMHVHNSSLITWINADDFFFPFAFDQVANVAKKFNDKVAWIGGQAAVINDKSKVRYQQDKIFPNDIIRLGLCDGIHWDFFQQEGTFVTGFLWKKALSQGIFNGFRLAGDWQLWKFMASQTQYYQLKWPLAAFRMREGQLTQVRKQDYQSEIDTALDLEQRHQSVKLISQQSDLWAFFLKNDQKSDRLIAVRENMKDRFDKYIQTKKNIHIENNHLAIRNNPQSNTSTTNNQKVYSQNLEKHINIIIDNEVNSFSLENDKCINRQMPCYDIPSTSQFSFGPGWYMREKASSTGKFYTQKSGILHLSAPWNGVGKFSFAVNSSRDNNIIYLRCNGNRTQKFIANKSEKTVGPINLKLRKGTNILEMSSKTQLMQWQADIVSFNFEISNIDLKLSRQRTFALKYPVKLWKLLGTGMLFDQYYESQLDRPYPKSLLKHYYLYGAWQGKNPNPLFDSRYYLEQNKDVYLSGTNPLLHYISHGWKEGRDPHPDFNGDRYLQSYTDVAETGMNPLLHYLKHGLKEGRKLKTVAAISRTNPAASLFHSDDPKYITFSKRSHWKYFNGLDEQLYGKTVDMDDCVLKKYQDLLVLLFIIKRLKPGMRILEVGGGKSRILEHFADTFECWNVDKLEGLGDGPHDLPDVPYKLVRDYIGNFNNELKDGAYDFVFSISALEHTPENHITFKNIIKDINRLLKPGGYSFHLFDVVFKENGQMWTNGLVYEIFKNVETLNKYVKPADVKGDKEVYYMNKSAYDRTWLHSTKREYNDFGRPASLNILWQKPY